MKPTVCILGAGGGYRLPTHMQPVCQMAETSSCAALHFLTPLFDCQRSCVSVGRDQQLCILFADLCCLSAGRDTVSISDKKCDRPRGEGAPRVKPTVCILGAEAKALSADKRFPCKRVVLRWFFYSERSTKSSSLRRVWTMRGQKLRRF